MGVHEPPAEAREELLAHDLHEPGGHHEVGFVRGDGLGEGGVPLLAGLEVLDLADEGGNPGPLGPREPLDVLAVRPDGHDLGTVGRRAARLDGVQQRL